MDLELAISRCERLIDLQRGDEAVWTSHEMQEILVELAKMLSTQMHPDQARMMREEVDYLRTETAHLYHCLNAAEDMAAVIDFVLQEESGMASRQRARFIMAVSQWRELRVNQ